MQTSGNLMRLRANLLPKRCAKLTLGLAVAARSLCLPPGVCFIAAGGISGPIYIVNFRPNFKINKV